jgi:hypothetical protein
MKVQEHLEQAQQHYKSFDDRHHRDLEFTLAQNRVPARNAYKVGAVSICLPLSPMKIRQLVGLLNKCAVGR